MQRAIEKFRLNIKSVRELDNLYTLLIKNYPLSEEQSGDILRAEVVLAISALDCFIHDLVKQGMIETYQGIRTSSKQFESYQIPFKFLKLIENAQLDFLKSIENNAISEDNVKNAIKDNELIKLTYLENAIKEVNSKDSYQSVKNINYALGLIDITKVWSSLANKMNIKASSIEEELSLIINRRNKIAHEADYDALTGSKTPIEQQNINDVIQFIEKLCESIYQIAQTNIT